MIHGCSQADPDRSSRSVAEAAWTAALRRLLLPAGDALFGQRMLKRLSFLEEAQWWSRDRLSRERNRLLSETVATAYRDTPFYRDLMDEARVRPPDIRTPSDLARLPVVTKSMLRAAYPDRVTRHSSQKTYESHTSGSTGQNFAVREDPETRGWYLASFLLSLEWAGWEIGERHMQTGMTLERSLARKLKDGVLRCHYVSAFDLDDEHLDRALDTLERYRIDHLWGYAASLFFLARRALERGWNRPLRSVVTWGDNLYRHYRRTIESAFRSKVLDTYGVGEGIQVAAQCGCGDNYHIHELDVIVEYVDDAGCPVSRERPGNLILTRLHAGPMPLIRYQVGDVGVQGEQSPCQCGRALERMHSIEGRDTDVVVTPSGNRLIVEFFNGIIDDFPEIEAFQVRQDEINSILVRLVPRAEYAGGVGNRLIEAMRRNGASDLEIDIELVESIPLTRGGKRRYVVSNVSGHARKVTDSVESEPLNARSVNAEATHYGGHTPLHASGGNGIPRR